MAPTLRTQFLDPKDANVALQSFDFIVVIVALLLFDFIDLFPYYSLTTS
jgi:hypothetical protein